jgi:hypothetical protein
MEKAEAAFKRAAYKAIHGTREERSGRFVVQRERAPARSAPKVSRGSSSRQRKSS